MYLMMHDKRGGGGRPSGGRVGDENKWVTNVWRGGVARTGNDLVFGQKKES